MISRSFLSSIAFRLPFAIVFICILVFSLSAIAIYGLQRARDTYAASVKRGSLTEDAMEQRLALITGVTDYAALADADVVVEAVFEEMGVKQQVFEQLDAVCKPGAILASNTSSLDLNAIAAFTKRPEDVVGLPAAFVAYDVLLKRRDAWRSAWTKWDLWCAAAATAAPAKTQKGEPGALRAPRTAAETIGISASVAFTTGMACIAAAYAVGKVGAAALGAAAERPELLGRSLLFVGLAEGIAIYGLIIAILLARQLG